MYVCVFVHIECDASRTEESQIILELELCSVGDGCELWYKRYMILN